MGSRHPRRVAWASQQQHMDSSSSFQCKPHQERERKSSQLTFPSFSASYSISFPKPASQYHLIKEKDNYDINVLLPNTEWSHQHLTSHFKEMGTSVPDTYYSNANLRVRLKTQFLFISDYKEQMAFSLNWSQIACGTGVKTQVCV